MTLEQKARVSIDALLPQKDWRVSNVVVVNICAVLNVGLREVSFAIGFGVTKYLRNTDDIAVGAIDIKKEGYTSCRRRVIRPPRWPPFCSIHTSRRPTIAASSNQPDNPLELDKDMLDRTDSVFPVGYACFEERTLFFGNRQLPTKCRVGQQRGLSVVGSRLMVQTSSATFLTSFCTQPQVKNLNTNLILRDET